MLVLAILMWIMMELGAPDWCFTLWWISAICTGIKLCMDLINLGKEMK